MGFFTDHAITKLYRQAGIDRKPKTDTLQQDQPDGGIVTMANNTITLSPYTANTGAVTGYGQPYFVTATGQLGANQMAYNQSAGNYVSGTNTVYTYATTVQQWPTATLNTLQGIQGIPWGVEEMIPPRQIDRAEFSEEEISQAEKIMEELGA